MTASVLRFPPHPATALPELPDLPEQGPDRLARHRVTLYDALLHKLDCDRALYLAEGPFGYRDAYRKPPRDDLHPYIGLLLADRRRRMADNIRRVRAALRDLAR